MPEVIRNYFFVTKPGMVLGNLVSAAAGFLLASKGHPDPAVLLASVGGISLVIACACVLNNCLDRRMDRLMIRTRDRVLATGRMSPLAAVCYAAVLGIAGAGLIRAATNWLPVLIVAAGLAVYVGIYSLYLKRNSIYSTIVGSLAGAAPPLAGYCAASHRFDLGAMILLAIFSLWQMPHAYAIAIFRRSDYTAAAIPVLPLKRGTAVAKKHMAGYILAFIAAAAMLTCGGYTGYIYLSTASAAGLFWLYLACSGCAAADERQWARRLFVVSLLSITVLNFMMAIDFRIPPAANHLLTCTP